MEYAVYVPNGIPTIDAGSAVVGRPLNGQPDLVELYLEGDRYGIMKAEAARLGIDAFEWCMFHAADRMAHSYPTIARMWVPRRDVIEVGTYDYDTRTLHVSNEPLLRQWKESR
jgi:hypothetical protein